MSTRNPKYTKDEYPFGSQSVHFILSYISLKYLDVIHSFTQSPDKDYSIHTFYGTNRTL